ncbi:hypothetical protein BDR05DRAFT_961487 [Suillus weaverae]|nr:hypothetical protein BDR05DRAFT_961487 [Suillus weaverae]
MISFFVSASVSVSVAVSLTQPPSLKHFYVCPSHTERRQLLGYPRGTRCLRHFVRAVSKCFEPSREGRTVIYHGHRRGCDGISG